MGWERRGDSYWHVPHYSRNSSRAKKWVSREAKRSRILILCRKVFQMLVALRILGDTVGARER